MDAMWRSKQYKKQTRGNQTRGRDKTEACKAKPLERFMAKRSRSYKHKSYASWAGFMKVGNTRISIYKN